MSMANESDKGGRSEVQVMGHQGPIRIRMKDLSRASFGGKEPSETLYRHFIRFRRDLRSLTAAAQLLRMMDQNTIQVGHNVLIKMPSSNIKMVLMKENG